MVQYSNGSDYVMYCLQLNKVLTFFTLFILGCAGFIGLLLGLNFVVGLVRSLFSVFGTRFNRTELVTQYECGFIPFSDSRVEFSVQFYLVALLFVLFDVEISLLLPLPFILTAIGFEQLYTVWLFLFILVFGFIVEWFSGVLTLEVRHYRIRETKSFK